MSEFLRGANDTDAFAPLPARRERHDGEFLRDDASLPARSSSTDDSDAFADVPGRRQPSGHRVDQLTDLFRRFLVSG